MERIRTVSTCSLASCDNARTAKEIATRKTNQFVGSRIAARAASRTIGPSGGVELGSELRRYSMARLSLAQHLPLV
jgi:hypothetical protein